MGKKSDYESTLTAIFLNILAAPDFAKYFRIHSKKPAFVILNGAKRSEESIFSMTYEILRFARNDIAKPF